MNSRTEPRREICSRDTRRLICLLGSIVGWICALLFNSRALASDSNAHNCIGATGQQGHTDSGFWSEFKNNCGYTVDASFDVLLFQCEQDDYSACGNDALLKVHTSVQHTFGASESFTVASGIPYVRCFSYQWDINLETPGCNLPGECFSQALTATYAGTSGEQFRQTTNCSQCGACCAGDTTSCTTGCGSTVCDASGNWDSSACTYPNSCGGCGPATECCPGTSANCEECGVMLCDGNGSWDLSACTKKNSCGQCANDTGACCQGAVPTCEPSTLKPSCMEGSWTCPKPNGGRTVGSQLAGGTGAAGAGGTSVAGKAGSGGMAGSTGHADSSASTGTAGASGRHHHSSSADPEEDDSGIGCSIVLGGRDEPRIGVVFVTIALGLARSRLRRKRAG